MQAARPLTEAASLTPCAPPPPSPRSLPCPEAQGDQALKRALTAPWQPSPMLVQPRPETTADYFAKEEMKDLRVFFPYCVCVFVCKNVISLDVNKHCDIGKYLY